MSNRRAMCQNTRLPLKSVGIKPEYATSRCEDNNSRFILVPHIECCNAGKDLRINVLA